MKNPEKLQEFVEAKPERREPTVREALEYIAGHTSDKETSYATKKLAKAILDGTWYRNLS